MEKLYLLDPPRRPFDRLPQWNGFRSQTYTYSWRTPLVANTYCIYIYIGLFSFYCITVLAKSDITNCRNLVKTVDLSRSQRSTNNAIIIRTDLCSSAENYTRYRQSTVELLTLLFVRKYLCSTDRKSVTDWKIELHVISR